MVIARVVVQEVVGLISFNFIHKSKEMKQKIKGILSILCFIVVMCIPFLSHATVMLNLPGESAWSAGLRGLVIGIVFVIIRIIYKKYKDS